MKTTNYLTLEEAKKYKDQYIELFATGKLNQIAQKILSRKTKRIQNLITAENAVQQLSLEFLRPVKGQGMKEHSELHRFRLFNPTKSKFETYIYQCMSNLITTMIDNIARKPDPISYNNLNQDEENEENPFLNVLSSRDGQLNEDIIDKILNGFRKILSPLENFVFEYIILEKQKTKTIIDLAKDKLKNPSKMYLKLLEAKKEIPLKFINYVNSLDYFEHYIPEKYANALI